MTARDHFAGTLQKIPARPGAVHTCLRGESFLSRGSGIEIAMITLIPWSSALRTQADHYGALVADSCSTGASAITE